MTEKELFIEQISSIFFAGASLDTNHLIRRIREDLGISTEKSQRLLYKIILYANSSIFPPITKLDLILTTGCNLACKYCFEKNCKSQNSMENTTAKSAIDLLFDYSANESNLTILFFGGEPTLKFDLIKEITEYAEKLAVTRKKTIEFDMTSNGVLLNEEMTDFFSSHKIKVLLSIDGLKESHDRFRIDKSGNGTFERVIQGMKLLKKSQTWIGTKMTVSQENIANLYDDVLGLYELGVNDFLIGHATDMEWSLIDREKFNGQLKKLYSWYKNSSRNDIKLSGDIQIGGNDPSKKSNSFVCEAGTRRICVNTNGEVSACGRVLALNNLQLLSKLGDVKYGIYNLNNRLDFVSGLKLRSACSKKGIANDYRGGCYAENYYENQDIFQPNIQEYLFSKIKPIF